MTDLQATLDAIDQVAVHECGHCRKPLDVDGPSRDFCSESCQTSWTRAKQQVTALVGYREPVDLLYPEIRRPGGFVIPPEFRAAAEAARDAIANLRYGTSRDREPAVQPGEWRALLAAPWHPAPLTVRPSFADRPPDTIHTIRPAPQPLWTLEDEADPFGPAIHQDLYRLESVDERTHTALYRVQGLPGPRYAVFRGWGYLPSWWTRDGWEGRWEELMDGATGYAWAPHEGGRLVARPTERYETREDGAVAEVWGVRP